MSDKHGLLVVISGPSGVGKTTITHQLVQRLGAVFSVSMTTRPKSAADTEGVDYYFVDELRFERAIADGELLEWAKVFTHYYGTPRGPVEHHLHEGRDVILEIDVNGAEQIKKAMPDALAIFVNPPSEEELLRRLRARAREGEDVIQRRFREAQREMKQTRGCGAYDHFIINENLDEAINHAYQIVTDHKAAV
jgi:guanylate kinase